jgi:hypothetical protein
MERVTRQRSLAAPAPLPRRARPGGVLALREAAGNRAFGQLVRAAVARDAAGDLKKVGVTDTWLTDRLGASELGKTAGKRSIELRLFPGKTARRALVIGGVHGTERQGVQVARLLEKDLAASPADFSVLLVPVLFPDNAEKGTHGIREGGTPTNRNFPTPDKDLAASGGKDATGRDILPENQLLMKVMEAYKPERIISLHGTQHPERAGVFYDPRQLTEAERLESARTAGASARPRPSDSEGASEARFRTLYDRSIADKLAAAGAADKDLSLRAAKLIDAQTAGVKGRESRNFGGNKAREAHGSVAGNVGKSGDLDTGFWGGEVPGGTSLGGYASARGTSIFTVEPPVNRNIADYGKGGDTAGDKVSQADRTTELQAYADAVRTVLLGK